MIRLLLSVFLAVSGLVVKGEHINRCDSSPMNLCGSDFVIYKSECDFLVSKAKISDLTILDLADCITSDFEAVSGNFSELNTTENTPNLDSRSLRGNNLSKRDSVADSDNVTLSLTNDTQMTIVESMNENDESSVNNTALVNGSISDEKHFQDTVLENATYNDVNDILNAFYMGERNSIFKEINKYNVNMINVIVENFDISSFILSNGKYNLSRISMLVLESVIKILRNQKSKLQNYLNQLKGIEFESINNNYTTTNPTYKALKRIDALNLNRTYNPSIFGQREYSVLNVTFRFINLNNASNFLTSPLITDFALQSLDRMNIDSLKHNEDSSILGNNMNNSVNIDDISDHIKAMNNRLLLTSEHEYAVIKGIDSNNGENSYLSKTENCEINTPSRQEAPVISNFHCIFPKNSTGDNLQMASNKILSMTQITLGNLLEDKLRYNSTIIPHEIFNPIPNITSLLEANSRVLLSNSSEEGEGQEDLVLDFFDLLLSPLNFTNNDLSDFGIGEIFVNFDLNFLMGGEPIGPMISNVNETAILEEIDEIFNLDSLLKDLNSIEKKSNNTTNSTLLSTLRITSEVFPKINSNFTVDDIFRDFPPAFDRVRGPDCIVKCDDQVDLHCANNGVTYKNLCEFRNAQCNDKKLIFVSFGKCLPLIIRG
ncbi:kazal-type serine protease inhibitor domain-containing [Cryptosporidium sp. chipmunk genotype I]|uniref:kazal-type serine protease inhibitor domain-containing n=1 Tax=Cryptosporidium sp. chipmunk genotype I TaxID=1280935 RepID=UPI00351A5ABA|nr:kazal-type serine protease inhibitor domain-containing [Cryptosporidium sp. chipmunk genotype I]